MQSIRVVWLAALTLLSLGLLAPASAASAASDASDSNAANGLADDLADVLGDDLTANEEQPSAAAPAELEPFAATALTPSVAAQPIGDAPPRAAAQEAQARQTTRQPPPALSEEDKRTARSGAAAASAQNRAAAEARGAAPAGGDQGGALPPRREADSHEADSRPPAGGRGGGRGQSNHSVAGPQLRELFTRAASGLKSCHAERDGCEKRLDACTRDAAARTRGGGEAKSDADASVLRGEVESGKRARSELEDRLQRERAVSRDLRARLAEASKREGAGADCKGAPRRGLAMTRDASVTRPCDASRRRHRARRGGAAQAARGDHARGQGLPRQAGGRGARAAEAGVGGAARKADWLPARQSSSSGRGRGGGLPEPSPAPACRRAKLQLKEELEEVIEGRHSRLAQVYKALEGECQAELDSCRAGGGGGGGAGGGAGGGSGWALLALAAGYALGSVGPSPRLLSRRLSGRGHRAVDVDGWALPSSMKLH